MRTRLEWCRPFLFSWCTDTTSVPSFIHYCLSYWELGKSPYIGMCLFSSKASYQKPVIKSKFLLSVHAQNLALLPDPPSNFCVPVESQTCLKGECVLLLCGYKFITWLVQQWPSAGYACIAGYLEPLSILLFWVPHFPQLHCLITRGN